MAELVARVGEVETQLTQARADSDRLTAVIAERERGLRLSEQHVHSERALRAEVEQQLRERGRAAGQERRILHDRVADLERELGRMRRSVDEAQHLVAAAQGARRPRQSPSRRRVARSRRRSPSPPARSASPATPAPT